MSFAAQYEGRCAAGDEIRPGDEVEYVVDQLAHVGTCAVAVRGRVRREATREVCSSCWLVKPCECDDERKTA